MSIETHLENGALGGDSFDLQVATSLINWEKNLSSRGGQLL